MDLTYMPGELDLKNDKKNSDADMKREHDSVDDFEHLDPDSSPVDSHPKDLTSEKFDDKLASSSKNFLSREQDTSNKLLGDIVQDDLHSLGKNTEALIGNITSIGKDLKSDYDSEVHEVKSKIDTILVSETEKHDDKTDNESDLLNLGHKTESDEKHIQVLHSTDDFSELLNNRDISKEESGFDNNKSMKEADALSQYEMKLDKKDIGKNDEVEDDYPEPASEEEITEFEAEPAKSEAPSLGQQSEKPKEESHDPKLEPLKIHHDILEEPHDLPSKEDSPLKPFIAICPPKPSTPDTAKEVMKKASISDLDDIIGPEDVFKRIGLVEALVYWRDPKKSGVVFGSIMAILLSLCYMSLISVVAYSSLLTLAGTICFRIYKNILQAVQKTSEGHPFKEFLELELSLPQDKVREIVDTAVVHINAAIVELRRLFLVEDLVDSIKFGVCLWCLTYVGAIFNGMTLVILAFVALFTVPKIYENNKASIDTYIDMGRSKVAEITSKVKAAVPIGKKEPEKDKEQ